MTLQLSEPRTPARVVAPERSGFSGPSWLEPLIQELAGYRDEMCNLRALNDPKEVFMRLSAWHARVNVIRALTYQNESRQAAAFRTHEVNPFVDACEYQFKTWSRIQATTESEMKLSRGVV